jgi:hypothetical protein
MLRSKPQGVIKYTKHLNLNPTVSLGYLWFKTYSIQPAWFWRQRDENSRCSSWENVDIENKWQISSKYRIEWKSWYLRKPGRDFRLQTSDFGLQTSDFGLRTSDFGLRTSDFRPRTSDFRLRASDFRHQTSDFRFASWRKRYVIVCIRIVYWIYEFRKFLRV